MANVYRHSRRKSATSLSMLQQPDQPPPSFWRRLVAPPDPLQVDAGASGELLVAEIRLLLTLLLLNIPLVNLGTHGDSPEALVGLGIALVATIVAFVVYLFMKRGFYRQWLGFASSVFDVSLVSGALVVFLALGSPHTAVNSKVLFDVYFLAIGATSLRYDVRICVLAGVLAVTQYSGILLYATAHWDLNAASFAPFPSGMFDWNSQFARLILLTTAAVLSGTIVLRTQSLRRLSRSDRLTGLPNRSYFDERVMAEMSRARRYGHPISLAMIDVDHFKRFNDTLGHAAGDVALKTVANTIKKMVRESDLVVRYGGEEFVAVFPGMNAGAAMERVEAIRGAIAEVPLQLSSQSPAAQLTISAGVAAYGVDGVEVEDLLDISDSRLFQAKEGGRNRVVGPPVEMLAAPPTWRSSGHHGGGPPK